MSDTNDLSNQKQGHGMRNIILTGFLLAIGATGIIRSTIEARAASKVPAPTAAITRVTEQMLRTEWTKCSKQNPIRFTRERLSSGEILDNEFISEAENYIEACEKEIAEAPQQAALNAAKAKEATALADISKAQSAVFEATVTANSKQIGQRSN
jgi:hypothetical protein